MGQDYPRFATPQQQELLLSLEAGSFPLYAPGFCGGQSASACGDRRPSRREFRHGHALDVETLARLAQVVLWIVVEDHHFTVDHQPVVRPGGEGARDLRDGAGRVAAPA